MSDKNMKINDEYYLCKSELMILHLDPKDFNRYYDKPDCCDDLPTFWHESHNKTISFCLFAWKLPTVPLGALIFLFVIVAFLGFLVFLFLYLNKMACFANCGGCPCLEEKKKKKEKQAALGNKTL